MFNNIVVLKSKCKNQQYKAQMSIQSKFDSEGIHDDMNKVNFFKHILLRSELQMFCGFSIRCCPPVVRNVARPSTLASLQCCLPAVIRCFVYYECPFCGKENLLFMGTHMDSIVFTSQLVVDANNFPISAI